MDERAKLIEAIELTERYILRARDVLSGPPYQVDFDDYDVTENVYSIALQDGEAFLTRCRVDHGYYDSGPSLETEANSFPDDLLFLSSEELAAWKQEHLAAYNAKQADRARMEAAARETEERALLDRLKQRYEPDQ